MMILKAAQALATLVRCLASIIVMANATFLRKCKRRIYITKLLIIKNIEIR